MFEGWFAGFVSGVIATLIGFGLTILWDTIKYNRDVRSRDLVLMQALFEEVKENRKIVDANLKTLLAELTFVKENKFIVEPISLIRESMWEMIKVNPPTDMIKSKALLSAFRETSSLISRINEVIHSREQYRVLSVSAIKQMEYLGAYDETLVRIHTSLRSSLDVLQSELSHYR
jgi:hypothetical protein